jgi:SAM-dependent methyltransferase
MTDPTFPDHFSDRAAGYREYRPTYPRELVDFLADTSPGTALAWEAGCGSGQLSVGLLERFDRVVATDASAEQLAHARRHERIEYRRALAEDSGLPAHCADLAVAAQAAHWFDLDAYYAEVKRVARRGAVIALICYDLLSAGDDVDPIVSHFYREVLAPYWPPERRLVEAGYRTIPFPFEEIPAPALELHADWTLEQLLGYARTWSGVRALEKARGPGAVEALGEELAPLWGDGGKATRRITWPLAMRVGRVG